MAIAGSGGIGVAGRYPYVVLIACHYFEHAPGAYLAGSSSIELADKGGCIAYPARSSRFANAGIAHLAAKQALLKGSTAGLQVVLLHGGFFYAVALLLGQYQAYIASVVGYVIIVHTATGGQGDVGGAIVTWLRVIPIAIGNRNGGFDWNKGKGEQTLKIERHHPN